MSLFEVALQRRSLMRFSIPVIFVIVKLVFTGCSGAQSAAIVPGPTSKFAAKTESITSSKMGGSSEEVFTLTANALAPDRNSPLEYCFIRLLGVDEIRTNEDLNKVTDVVTVLEKSISNDVVSRLSDKTLLNSISDVEETRAASSLEEIKLDLERSSKGVKSVGIACNNVVIKLKQKLELPTSSEDEPQLGLWGRLVFWGVGAFGSLLMGGDLGDFPKVYNPRPTWGVPAVHRPYW
jgi:hypothetical protein